MEDKLLKQIEGKCQKIYSKLSTLILWEWDDRLKSPLAEVNTQQSKKVRDILSKEFDKSWNAESIEKAPELIRDIANALYGIREEQLLFTTDATPEILLFATWWPWGNGEKISIRIGMVHKDKMSVSEIELTVNIRKWFKLK